MSKSNQNLSFPKMAAPPPLGSVPKRTATGSATGNPRNKCALQPGHSLMDWIRLGNSGKDLTGTGGRHRNISLSELAKHNTQDDAWLAIRGKVYNVTHYMNYHPGGPEELMRGVGIDATNLFDEVHAWVNYESLLSKCLVGPLGVSRDEPDLKDIFKSTKDEQKNVSSLNLNIKNDEIKNSNQNLKKSDTNLEINNETETKTETEVSNVLGDIIEPIKKDVCTCDADEFKLPLLRTSYNKKMACKCGTGSNNSKTIPVPRFDWIQVTPYVTFIFYTREFSNPYLFVLLNKDQQTLTVDITYDEKTFRSAMNLKYKVKFPFKYKITQDTGKIELKFEKDCPVLWDTYGEISNFLVHRKRSFVCDIIEKEAITQNEDAVLVIYLKPREWILSNAAIGHHYTITVTTKEGVMITKPYTPLTNTGFHPKINRLTELTKDFFPISFVIKGYHKRKGGMSVVLTEMCENAIISESRGKFNLNILAEHRRVLLIAGGTGMAPILSLTHFLLSRKHLRTDSVHMIFYAHSETHIFFQEVYERINKNDPRFTFQIALCSPISAWTGLRGRPAIPHFQPHFAPATEEPVTFVSTCGPPGMCEKVSEIVLTHFNMSEDNIWPFLG